MNPSKPKDQKPEVVATPEVLEVNEVVNEANGNLKLPAYSMILGVRRIREGSFAGLWELTELDEHMAVKRVITDANTRSIVINLAAREIGKAV